MYQKIKIFIILLLIGVVKCHFKGNLNISFWNQVTNHDQVLVSWTKLSHQTLNLDLLTSGLASKLDALLEDRSNVTSKCAQSLLRLRSDAQKMKFWAINALESWGRFPPEGFFGGTLSSLGDYDSCLKDDRLQYCTVHLRPLLPLRKLHANINHEVALLREFKINKDQAISMLAEKAQLLYYTAMRIGICLPNDCSSNEIDHFLQAVSSKIELKSKLIGCETNEIYKSKFDIYAIVAIISFCVLISLSLIGTFVDNLFNDRKSDKDLLLLEMTLAFSLRKNLNSLFKNDTNVKEFKCLNGIRVFTLIWIISCHTLLWMNHYMFSNIFNIHNFLNNFYLSGLLNGFFAVNTFFLVSGLLTTYISLNSSGKSFKNFNLFLFAISRYIRLTPGVMFSTASFFLLPYLGSGPFFTEVVKAQVDNCRHHWLANLFYLQTNIPNEDSSSICNLSLWWVSIEMKLHFLSAIIVICFFFRPKLSVFLISATTLCSILWAFVDHFVNDYPPFHGSTVPEIEEFWKFISDFLHKIHTHIGPFFIGLFIGYLFTNDKKINISQGQKIIGWSSSCVAIVCLLYGPYPWVLGYRYSKWSAALYASTSQTIWSLSISWIIFACVNGFGGVVNKVLTFEAFRPLSRVIYMTYLLHGQVLILFSGTRNKLVPLEASNLIYIVIGHIVISFIYGFVMTLLVESPTLNLIKILMKRVRKPSQNDCNNNFDCEISQLKPSL